MSTTNRAGLLPGRIPPQTLALVDQLPSGAFVANMDWYLFFYNLAQQVLSNTAGTIAFPPALIIPLDEIDVSSADFIQASKLQALLLADQDVPPALRDMANALLLAQDGLLQDPPPASAPLTFNTQTASYTLLSSDYTNNVWVEMNVAGANVLTVPPDSTALCPIGYTVLWSQLGAGQITFTAGAGVTILQASSLTSRAQNSAGGLTKKAANTWYLYGDTT